jgi:lipopolysaccharide transport system ATP-binding protein
LGDFIDQPLKTYSTGMRMRLGFAMVSTLEPDILIVDEALSVGDIHFQKKCIDRMMGIKNSGKTIIFCSHSIYQISMFCDQVLWLKQGRIEQLGPTANVVPLYEAYQMQKDPDKRKQSEPKKTEKHTPVRIAEFTLLNELPITQGDDLGVRLEIECEDPDLPYHVTLSLKMDTGRAVFVTGTHLEDRPALTGVHRTVEIEFPAIPLLGGLYSLHARIFDDHGLMIYHEKVLPDLTATKTSAAPGVCHLQNQWKIT